METTERIDDAGHGPGCIERLHTDVMAVPPDQRALGLAEKILDQAVYKVNSADSGALRYQLGVIQGNAERLVALLERQAKLVEALDRIAGTPREGEPLEGTYQEHCGRNIAAAYAELDALIVIAREARGGEA